MVVLQRFQWNVAATVAYQMRDRMDKRGERDTVSSKYGTRTASPVGEVTPSKRKHFKAV
jgi:hypothetical protein